MCFLFVSLQQCKRKVNRQKIQILACSSLYLEYLWVSQQLPGEDKQFEDVSV